MKTIPSSSRTLSIKITLLFLSIALLFACTETSTNSTTNKPNSNKTPTNPTQPPPNPSIDPPMHNITFLPTNLVFTNPERGFYCFGDDPEKLNNEALDYIYKQECRLIYIPCDLSKWRNTDIPDDYLKSIQNAFSLMRQKGLKAILRFAYDYVENGKDYHDAVDAPLEQVKKHIQQLKPIINNNADVIAIWQAGFIGPWGEWHTSKNKLDTNENKRIILEALLESLHPNLQLAVRYPYDLITWYKTPADENDLQQNNIKSRVSMHNDCFMSGPNDVGTYDPQSNLTPEQMRDFVKKHSQITAFGGETCNSQEKLRLSCKHILEEGEQYHLTYLNQDFYELFIKTWKKEKCMEDIKRKMGYRFELQNLQISAETKAGSTLQWILKIANNGWGRIINPRYINLRLTNTNNSIMIPLPETNLRNIPALSSITWKGTITLPDSMPTGEYELEIAAPDASESLKNLPIFSLRFANEDKNDIQWNSETGSLRTGLKIIIK